MDEFEQQPFSDVEFVENPEHRCPVILLLDTSYSMSGAPIVELNGGLSTRKRSFRPWNQRGRFHSPRPILAIEGAFPIPSQGPEPDILFRLVGLPVPVVAPAPLGGPDAGPAGGPVNGAGVARGLDPKVSMSTGVVL